MVQSATDSMGRPRGKREVIDVQEIKPKDKSLDQLIRVRKQRLERFERDCREAREAWRAARKRLRVAKESWRAAVAAALEFWQQTRSEFFSMTITSGQFRRGKAAYERMKSEAAQLHLAAREAVEPARQERQAYFAAARRVVEANREQEKLGILRDEIWRLNRQEEW